MVGGKLQRRRITIESVEGKSGTGWIARETSPSYGRLILHQRFSEITGKLQISGREGRIAHFSSDLWGHKLTFLANFGGEKIAYGRLNFRFKGRVKGNRMQGVGVLKLSENGKKRKQNWKAKREKTDYCGTWQWPAATENSPVELRIERRKGHYRATYVDGDKEIPVSHFYDWGGGFYFALLIGRTDAGLTLSEDTGWLIGEAIVQQGRLKGRIEFYPSHYEGPGLGEGMACKPIVRDWEPNLVQSSGRAEDENK
ncbi:MAG: hypothetical protein ACLFWL_16620 [Candidatus Brocadiia bacterium]